MAQLLLDWLESRNDALFDSETISLLDEQLVRSSLLPSEHGDSHSNELSDGHSLLLVTFSRREMILIKY